MRIAFLGACGTGKTTLARMIAQKTDRTLRKLNCTTAGTQDIRDVVEDLNAFTAPNGILLYLDEIQYFNKRQQQTLLEYIENGSITLIASTTENPYFYVYSAILSRSTVFEFKSVTPSEAEKAVRRAFDFILTSGCEIFEFHCFYIYFGKFWLTLSKNNVKFIHSSNFAYGIEAFEKIIPIVEPYFEKVVVSEDIKNVYGNMIEAKDVPRIALKHINKVDKGNKVFSIYLGLNIDTNSIPNNNINKNAITEPHNINNVFFSIIHFLFLNHIIQ